MPYSIGARLAAGLLGVATLNAQAAVVDEKEIHAQLVERIDVRKWGTAIVVGVSTPEGRARRLRRACSWLSSRGVLKSMKPCARC